MNSIEVLCYPVMQTLPTVNRNIFPWLLREKVLAVETNATCSVIRAPISCMQFQLAMLSHWDTASCKSN